MSISRAVNTPSLLILTVLWGGGYILISEQETRRSIKTLEELLVDELLNYLASVSYQNL